MDLKLKDKSVFISGATTGIGFAIAQTFVNEKAKVYINGRNKETVEQAVTALKKHAKEAEVVGIAADLSSPEGFDIIKKEIQEVDILINNLGIYEPLPFFETSEKDWMRIFNINVLSGIKLTQYFMPKMLEKNWGRVIFISSESGIQIPSEMIHYGMSKTAQLAITNGLAQLTKGTQVTVNAILPGPTYSKGVQQFIQDLATKEGKDIETVEKEFFSETRPLSLLQRFITTDEVAAMAAYLSSPIAGATNGASMRVDGGIIKSF